LRKKLKFAIGILFLIISVACDALPDEKSSLDIPSTATAKSSQSPTVTVNQNWVILANKRAEETGIAAGLLENDGFWIPSVDDILKLEENLAGYLNQNSDQFYRQPPVWERLDEYQRQYIGFERNGRQIIYGNYFCDNLGKNWRQELIFVLDGGDCFFQVEYDVESGMFINLLVNGEA